MLKHYGQVVREFLVKVSGCVFFYFKVMENILHTFCMIIHFFMPRHSSRKLLGRYEEQCRLVF